jgi:DNA-binding transcriptional ArsR family regulator
MRRSNQAESGISGHYRSCFAVLRRILVDKYISKRIYNQTVINNADRLNRTFAALADPTRRAILARLASGEATVTELMQPFTISQPAISKHLRVLEQASLISRGRDAQRRPRSLEAGPLAEANEWLERYRQIWEGSFERLDDLLNELSTRDPEQHPRIRPTTRRKGASR